MIIDSAYLCQWRRKVSTFINSLGINSLKTLPSAAEFLFNVFTAYVNECSGKETKSR